MHLSRLDLVFWAAGFLGHVALFFVLIWRHRAKRFPIFTTLIAANIARTVTLYSILRIGGRHEYSHYYYTFWAFALLDTAMQFSVVYELTIRTFRPVRVWSHALKARFSWLIALSLTFAACLTWLANPPARNVMQTVVIKGDFFPEVCMIELFVGMLALSAIGGIPWKGHTAKISQGLGIYSMFNAITDVGHNYFGLGGNDHSYFILSHIRIVMYFLCLCFWIVAIWPDEAPQREMTEEMQLQLSGFRRRINSDLQKLRSGS
jgi:hypothetical protein